MSLYFHLSERLLKLQMSLPPLSFHSLRLSADIWIWKMPAALLSIRATDLTKQGSRSMSPFVTCHWGTSWAAGTPSGVLGQEGVLQLPVSGRFPLVPCCPPGTLLPNVPSQLSGTIWPVIHPSGWKASLRGLLSFLHPEEGIWWSESPSGDRDPPLESPNLGAQKKPLHCTSFDYSCLLILYTDSDTATLILSLLSFGTEQGNLPATSGKVNQSLLER